MSCNTEWRIEVGDGGKVGDVLALLFSGGLEKNVVIVKTKE